MAQDSMPWDGTTTGHAASTDVWSAPYSSAEWADAHSKLWQSNVAKGYVLPAYGNSLVVTANSPAAMNVLAGTGAIMIRGRVYENTAQQTLTVTAADATNPRIDRVVARITFASQTIELAVLAGTPAATPALPTLTQNATTYEISLAYIWVAALAASVSEAEIHDERIFAPNLEYAPFLSQENLIHNSEFMAFSRLNTVSASAGAPDYWEIVGTVTAWASATKPTQMSRGRAVQITAGAGDSGMSQSFLVKASTPYAFRLLYNITAGDAGEVIVTTDSASPGTITRNLRRTESWLEEWIYYTTEADATELTIQTLALGNGDIVKYGQVLAVEGYEPGPFRQVHEMIMCDWYISDPDFYTDAFVATGNANIDLTTDYEGLILPGARSVSLTLIIQSTNPAGSTNIIIQRPTGGPFFYLQIGGGLAATEYYLTGWVPILTHTQAFNIGRTVTAGTSTISVIIAGMQT